MKPLGLLPVALMACLVLTGCTGRHTPKASLSPVPAGPASLQQAWKQAATPLSGVANIGGVALLYVKDGRALRIEAHDPVSGAVLWSDRASPALTPPDTAWFPLAVGGGVAYYEDAGGRAAKLVIADPRTGKKLAVTPTKYFGEEPYLCPNFTDALCEWLEDRNGKYLSYDRFSVAQPKLTVVKEPDDRQQISFNGNLFLNSTAKTLSAVQNEHVLWTKPATSLFGPHLQLYGRWYVALFREAGVFSGSAPSWRATDTTIDLTKTSTVGFRASDGKLLWRQPGTSFGCLNTTQVPTKPASGSGIPLRCRYTGEVSQKRGVSHWTPKGKITVALERYDVVTGKALWSTPIGTAPIQANTDAAKGSARLDRRHLVDDDHLVVNTGTANLIVDLTTGKTTPATSSTQVWCASTTTMRYKSTAYDNKKPDYTIRGWGLTYPCDLQKKHSNRPVTAVPHQDSDSFADGIVIYTTTTSIVALRPPPTS